MIMCRLCFEKIKCDINEFFLVDVVSEFFYV